MTRHQFFTTIAGSLSPSGLASVQDAYWLVKEAHRRQSRRITGERYFEHLRRVAHHAHSFGYADSATLTLALLHDVVEDTFVPPSVLVSLFGQEMYEWVVALSKEIPSFHAVTGRLLGRAKLDTEAYYANLAQAPLTPRVIKSCDRLDNLKDFAAWEQPRKDKYITETNRFVLPIADATDPRIAAEIRRRLAL